MKTYRVHLAESTCGDVIVEALDSEDAEHQALLSPAVEWESESAVEVTNIIELDANGTEKK